MSFRRVENRVPKKGFLMVCQRPEKRGVHISAATHWCTGIVTFLDSKCIRTRVQNLNIDQNDVGLPGFEPGIFATLKQSFP